MSDRAGRGVAVPLVWAGVIALVLLGALATPAPAQWQIATADGSSSLKLGYLLQGRAEWDRAGEGDDAKTSQNLYLARIRLLFGGKINNRLTFFVETDAPGNGKAPAATKVDSTGTKIYPDMFIQDAMGTWKASESLLLDFGLLLTPGAYNHLQSAASLLALNYGPYTFIESDPLKAKVGRDVGLQARGVLARHVEYRAAVLQGVRGPATKDAPNARNSFRGAGRIAFSPFETANTLFYSGTSLGKKKAFTIGAAGDVQKDYWACSGDLFVDYPFDPTVAGTLQAAYCLYDGDEFLGSALVKQSTYLVEAGLTLVTAKVTPYVQFAGKDFDDDTEGKDETSLQLGLAWWLDGHKSNIKVGYTMLRKDDNPDHNVIGVQCQAFSF